MINPYSQKQRKPLHNQHKNKDNALLHVNPNLFPAYNKEHAYLTARPLTHRPKGKQNKKNRKSIRKDQFPEFAIKFRNQTFQSNKINESFSSRNHAQHNLEESFGRARENLSNKDYEKKCINTSKQYTDNYTIQPKQTKGITPTTQNKAYLSRFSQALDKIYKSLDVFNRGRISETNINKWIPQSALYFLGGVFQKIKQQRLSLSYSEFEALCKPLLNQSAEQDIKWFIQEVSGKQSQLVSINIPSEQKIRENSPVIMKMNNNYVNHYNQYQRASRNGSISNKKEQVMSNPHPIQFEQVLNNIKFKEKQLNIRLNSIKEKNQSNVNHPKGKVNQFSFYNTQKDHAANPLKHQTAQFNQITLQPSAINKEKRSSERIHNDYVHKRQPKIQKQVPNFTFQLPKKQIDFTNSNSNKKQKPIQVQRRDNTSEQVNCSSVPRTSRIVRQSIPKEITNSCSKRSSVDSRETDRLDKLSSRLEEYIKFNKQKLQQNKKFIKENSTPRK